MQLGAFFGVSENIVPPLLLPPPVPFIFRLQREALNFLDNSLLETRFFVQVRTGNPGAGTGALCPESDRFSTPVPWRPWFETGNR